MSRRASGGRKKAAAEDLELREEEEDEEEPEEESAPKSRRKTPARGAAKGKAAAGRGKRGKEAEPAAEPRQAARQPAPRKKARAQKVGAEEDEEEEDAAAALPPPPPPRARAAAMCKKEDAHKLFLQSFLGAPAKKASEAGEVAERVNALCGTAHTLAAFVAEANRRLDEEGLDVALRRAADEREGAAHWVLANTRTDYASQQLGLPLPRPQREYLERLLEELARDGAGRLAVEECGTPALRGRLKDKEWAQVLDRLVALQLLQYAGAAAGGGPQWVLLGVRALAELGPHLSARAPALPPDCHFCREPAFHRSTCSACPLACHVHCEAAWLRSAAGAAKCCPGCKAFWKPREPVPRPPLRRAARSEEEDEGGVVKPEPQQEEQEEEEEEEMVVMEPQPLGRQSSFIDILN